MIEDLHKEADAYRARAAAEQALARAYYRHGEKAMGDRHYHQTKRYAEAATRIGA